MMTKKMMRWIVWGVVFTASITQASWVDTYKVNNGSFLQFPTSGWTITGTFDHQSTSIPGRSPYMLVLAPAVGQTVTATQQISGLLTYTEYRVIVEHAFWNNADPYWPNVRGAHSKVQVTTTGGTELGVYEAGYSGAWQNWSLSFNTGSNTTIIIKLIAYGDEESGWNNNYATWFDNVKLEKALPRNQWNFNSIGRTMTGHDIYKAFEDGIKGNEGWGLWAVNESPYEGALCLKYLDSGHRFYARAEGHSMTEGAYLYAYKAFSSEMPSYGSNFISLHMCANNATDSTPVRLVHMNGWLGIYGLAAGDCPNLVNVSQSLLNGSWHTIGVTYKDNEPIRVYLDGVQIAQSTYNYVAANHYNRGYFVLGNTAVDLTSPSNGDYPGYWAGAVGYYDTLMYDDHALSATTILCYHQNGQPQPPVWMAAVSRGHRVLIERGLQIQGLCSPVLPWTWQEVSLNATRFSQEGWFNTVRLSPWEASQAAFAYVGSPGLSWARVSYDQDSTTKDLKSWELPYLDKMVNFCLKDEQDMRISDNVTEAKIWCERNRDRYSDVISHTNQINGIYAVSDLTNYVTQVRPDMLSFDAYPYDGNLNALLGNSPTFYYGQLALFRQAAIAGLDGTGADPIPYAQYTQAGVWDGWSHICSESEVRNNHFAGLAFGYTMSCVFVYNDLDGYNWTSSTLFEGNDDSIPSPQFSYVAETNRQMRNLGPALVRLISTDVRMKMGEHYDHTDENKVWDFWPLFYHYEYMDVYVLNSLPSGVNAWGSAADPYLTGISITNLGTLNGSHPGDVILGYFKTLHEDFDGPSYSNQKYFMVVNSLAWPDGTAAQTRQRIRLNFNFGSSGITSLQRIRRNDGMVETVGLVSDGGSLYHLDLELDGGTGDLFKYNTGAPFVGGNEQVGDPSTTNIPGDANLDGMVDVGDLGILAANYGMTSGANWNLGDFNEDGAVDVGDLGILAANYGTNSKMTSDFNADYAKAFGMTVKDDSTKEILNNQNDELSSSPLCSGLGVSMVVSFLLILVTIGKFKS